MEWIFDSRILIRCSSLLADGALVVGIGFSYSFQLSNKSVS